ncbi:GNAT family N-acetyltransferase [Anaerocolumna chitinilytica]|uniref:Acetyltransferase n=1 Tax=Anaerocolumna chitinilytica TaxID=1727145 RepID=A0A7I8DNR5_9FIRM|nr:GNAT family N-acetyltransferase [Anaerocolumna chitinilytica]BCJ98705.1 acetyltransferase [Anaerocolumna chitinilytica]
MIYFKTLDNISIEVVHKTFQEAFSDYQVKIELPLWKFQQMLLRRGYHPAISIGAFQDERLVGIVLNGLRQWKGKVTAYDLGTGVIAEFRRQGITSEMLLQVKSLLKTKQVEQYLLEVLKTNQSAIELYNKQGFELQREFSCYQLEKEKFIPKTSVKVKHLERLELKELREFWNFEPSWQNSESSIEAVPEAFEYVIAEYSSTVIAYGMIDKKTGDIPQIAVHKDIRRKGIGSSILSELVRSTDAQRVSVLNVEASDKSMNDFLVQSGFNYQVGQYEMLLKVQF